jgi:uroporphyrin-III C-methyltransferase/precorrin-2 dehydrogenase/sirohydrochlorin ferrochelatase
MGIPEDPGSPVYPLSLRLAGRRVVVVGGGSVAFRRVAGLRAAEADVVVVSPQLSPTLGDLAEREVIAVHRREYQPGDLDGAWLVFACTDQPGVNAAVAADAEQQRIWCIRADDATASAAWVPAVGRTGAVTVAVNAGRNPRRAAALRDRLVATVEAEGRSAEKEAEPAQRGGGREARGRERQSGGGREARGRGKQSGGGREARGREKQSGRVSIVGGGPGDPGLITVTGLRRLRAADVVLADRLAPLELLDELPPDAYVIDAAKVPGGPAMRQDHINQALVEHARAGRAVVRLKGGDPFVFGRGREELEACLTAGVPVEVVPGVTSAIAVPAAAGIPVTHRGLSQGFCVLAGHVRPGDPRGSVDWAALARSGMTLVLLMAIDHLAAIAETLLAAGLGAGTPCAAVSDGWTRRQRVVTAPLRDLSAVVTSAGIANPAVIVIGDVARLVPVLPPGPAPGAFGPASPGQPAAGPEDTAASAAPGRPGSAGAAPDTTAAAADPPRSASSSPRAQPVPAPALRAHPLRRPPPPAPTLGTVAAADPAAPSRRVLVLGGARSGKSQTAEEMLADYVYVHYVATGAPPGSGDAEWDARVREHQERRPMYWQTTETLAVAEVLTAPDNTPPTSSAPVLVDCLTTWLARVMDDCEAWDGDPVSGRMLADRVDRLLDAWSRTPRHVIAVSNEVGSGVVPETDSGRRFRDELGRLNSRVAAASDEVWLCTAGIARRLR